MRKGRAGALASLRLRLFYVLLLGLVFFCTPGRTVLEDPAARSTSRHDAFFISFLWPPGDISGWGLTPSVPFTFSHQLPCPDPPCYHRPRTGRSSVAALRVPALYHVLTEDMPFG